MPWVRFDDRTDEHPKLSTLGDYAPLCGWLWFSACCYAMRHLTDGRIDEQALRRLWPFSHLAVETAGNELVGCLDNPKSEDLVSRLVSVNLLEEVGPGLYQIHDFLDYNPSRRDVLQARRIKAKSGRAGGEANAKAHAIARASRLVPLLDSSPSPSPSPSPTTRSRTNTIGPVHGTGPAHDVLSFLNQKAGRSYRAAGANLDLIRARLGDGIEPWQLKAIVSRKVREWTGTEMAKYLRPATLFNKTKCEQYLGELPLVAEVVDGDQ